MSTRVRGSKKAGEDPQLPPGNRLLASLPRAEYERLRPHLTLVPLRHRQVLQRAGHAVDVVYFPADGLCSMIMTMADGRTAEVATVGKEGMVGVAAFLGQATAVADTIVQIPGAFAYALSADIFAREMERRKALHDQVSRYSQALVAFLMHTAACNGLHAADQRCARWLLHSHDRIGRDWFELTQEFLAIMLGVRRATVSMIAQELQRSGLILFRRRGVTILNREGLEKLACECYRAVRTQFERLLPEIQPRVVPS
jgi:CRP-like cAMP-binding protein